MISEAKAYYYIGVPRQSRAENGLVLLNFHNFVAPVAVITEHPLDKLAKAVAMHETHDCVDDTNFTRVNNCFGIRKWNGKKLVPARYDTKKEAYDDFKEIWGRMYGTTIPTIEDSIKWSGGDRAVAWRTNVLWFLETI